MGVQGTGAGSSVLILGKQLFQFGVLFCPTIFAGGETIMVPGNNDFFSPLPREREIELAGKKVLLTHGHYYYVSLDLQTLREECIARGIDIVMFGHTHRPLIQIEDELTFINPGSISYPRQADKRCTYIMLEIDDNGEMSFNLKYV